MHRKKYLNFFGFLLLCLIWGSTWLAIKIGLEDSPPFLSAGLRFLIAVLFLIPWAKVHNLTFPREHTALAWMIFSGMLFFGLAYALVYWGEQFIPSGLTAVLFATLLLHVALLAHFTLPDEKLTFPKILGIILGIGGIAFIFSDELSLSGPDAHKGAIAILLSAFFSAIYNIIVKKKFHQFHPMVLAVIPMSAGAIFLLVVGVAVEKVSTFTINTASVGALLYLALIGSVLAFLCYYWLIKRMDVTKVALNVLITPILALFWGWLILGEPVTLKIILGSIFVIGGVRLATW